MQLGNMSSVSDVIPLEESGIIIRNHVICMDTQVLPATGKQMLTSYSSPHLMKREPYVQKCAQSRAELGCTLTL